MPTPSVHAQASAPSTEWHDQEGDKRGDFPNSEDDRFAVHVTSDRDLLMGWARGDEMSYEMLVTRYKALVHAVCRRHCPSQVVDDATQAVFFVLARRPDQAIQSPALGAWLVRTSWLISQQARRTMVTRHCVEVQVAADAPMETKVSSSENEAALEILEDELQDLPERQRIALTLQFYLGQSQAEIANQLGLQINAVKQLIHRGITTLRDRLRRRGVAVPIPCLAAMFIAAETRATDSVSLVDINPFSVPEGQSHALTLANDYIDKSSADLTWFGSIEIIVIFIIGVVLSLLLTWKYSLVDLEVYSAALTTDGSAQIHETHSHNGPAGEVVPDNTVPYFAENWKLVLDCSGTLTYNAGHIPGAIDVETHQQVLCGMLPTSLGAHIVVYGKNPTCNIVRRLVAQIRRQGYFNVEIYHAGVQGWVRAGGCLEIQDEQSRSL